MAVEIEKGQLSRDEQGCVGMQPFIRTNLTCVNCTKVSAIYCTGSGFCKSIRVYSWRMMPSRIIFAVQPFLDIWYE